MGCFGSKEYQAPNIKSVHFPKFKAQLPQMIGKVVLITGCTSGTGYICAKTCAELGAQVIMLNRQSERADKAFDKLRKEVPGSSITFIPCDLMSFQSVRDASERIRKELADTGLDVLVNNAGIMATPDKATTDGCDTQMQTNHLSHFLLTSELWPLLEQAAEQRGEARVANHSSEARRMPAKKLEEKYLGKNGGNLGGDSTGFLPMSGAPYKRYQQTKLANIVFTKALDDKLQASGSKIKALVAHPGASGTNLFRDGQMGKLAGVAAMMMQSGEDGTMPLLRCAVDPGAKSGEFYGPKNGSTGLAELLDKDGDKDIIDDESKAMLWKVSLEVTGAKDFA